MWSDSSTQGGGGRDNPSQEGKDGASSLPLHPVSGKDAEAAKEGTRVQMQNVAGLQV